MSPGRIPAASRGGRILQALGIPGTMIGLFSIASFGFGLVILAREDHSLRDAGREALRAVVADAVHGVPVDYLNRTLTDFADAWHRAPRADRPARLVELRRALATLGERLDQPGWPAGPVTIRGLELAPSEGAPLASWRSPSAGPGPSPTLDGLAVGPLRLTVHYRVARPIERAAAALEASRRRLLLALLGLSGYSLLCLGTMVLHALNLGGRLAREAAQEATLDLADRTCHELGNVAFVLANERRNLADFVDLIDRLAAETSAVLDAASRRAGLDPATAARLRRALDRAYADRGLDPAVELPAALAVARDVLKQIGVGSEYVALTVRELDAYLKRSAVPVSPGPVAVDDCLDDALALLGPRLEAASARIERPAPSGDLSDRPTVRADRRLLVHALVNLLKNAIEATTAAGVAPALTLSVRAEGPTLWIGVADNGPGLPAPVRSRLFIPGVSTKGPGRGRGLSIVAESVRAQGGTIRASNRPSGGAEFLIGLPRAGPS